MAIQEPSGLSTIEAGTDDSHEDYNDNVTRENVLQVRYIRALVGEAGGVNTHNQVYLSAVDGKFYKAQATSDLSTMPSVGFIEEGKSQDQFAKAIREGKITDAGWSLTVGDVLVLSRETAGEFNYLSDEMQRDISPFSVQQVLGYVIEEDTIFAAVQLPALIAGGVVKELAFDESNEDPVGYGDRGVLRIEDDDGTLELVYYDNGGQRTQITNGGRLSVGVEMMHEGDGGSYPWKTAERLIFGCGTLEEIEPGTLKYTPSPLEELKINGTLSVKGTALDPLKAINIEFEHAEPVEDIYGIYVRVDPTDTGPAASTYGIRAEIRTPIALGITYKYIYAMSFAAYHTGAGEIRNSHGVVGIVGNVIDGTLVDGKGVAVSVWNLHASGTFTTATGFYVQMLNEGSGTTWYGIRLDDWSNAGTITTSYGIYIDASIDIGTTKWAIYSASASDSYLAGSLGIGTNAPVNKLHVLGPSSNPSIAVGVNNGIETITGGIVELEIGRASVTPYAIWLQARFNNSANVKDITLNPLGGNVGVGLIDPAYKLEVAGEVCLNERSSDPAEPPEGHAIMWMSDGTGYGADGDVCIASKAGGVTKKALLFVHAAGAAW